MYFVEIYIDEVSDQNKKGIRELLDLKTFDHLMKGIIKNQMLWICFNPIDKNYNRGICNLQKSFKFSLARKGFIYILQVIVPASSLKFIEN
jgi:hypothetical protein